MSSLVRPDVSPRSETNAAKSIRSTPMPAAPVDPSVPIARRYELTIATPVYAAVSLFLAIGAINSQNNLLFWAFGVSVGIMVISGFISGPALYNLRVTRSPPKQGRVGVAADIRYTLRSVSRRSRAFALVVEERPSGWARSVRRPEPVGVATVAPRAATRASTTWTPVERGVITLNRFEVRSTFPFGLLRKVLVFEHEERVVVGPPAIALRSGVFSWGGNQERQSLRSTPRLGDGDELHALREYTSGDPTNRIAWRASSRSPSLLVRQVTEPRSPTLHVNLRAPAPEAEPFLWERAIAVTVALAAAGIDQRRRVVIHLPSPEGRPIVIDAPPTLTMLIDAAAKLPSSGAASAWRDVTGRTDSSNTFDAVIIDASAASAASAASRSVQLSTGVARGIDVRDLSTWLDPAAELPFSLTEPVESKAQTRARRQATRKATA